MKSKVSKPKPKAARKQTPPTEPPSKIVVSTHPYPCDCTKCGMEYCDCSEPERGTVKAEI